LRQVCDAVEQAYDVACPQLEADTSKLVDELVRARLITLIE
jgi:hypothetical protein